MHVFDKCLPFNLHAKTIIGITFETVRIYIYTHTYTQKAHQNVNSHLVFIYPRYSSQLFCLSIVYRHVIRHKHDMTDQPTRTKIELKTRLANATKNRHTAEKKEHIDW